MGEILLITRWYSCGAMSLVFTSGIQRHQAIDKIHKKVQATYCNVKISRISDVCFRKRSLNQLNNVNECDTSKHFPAQVQSEHAKRTTAHTLKSRTNSKITFSIHTTLNFANLDKKSKLFRI